MKHKYQFETEEEKNQLIEQHQDKELVETQYLTNGNFLIFADPSPTQKEINALKQQNTKIMLALAELSAAVVGGSESG